MFGERSDIIRHEELVYAEVEAQTILTPSAYPDSADQNTAENEYGLRMEAGECEHAHTTEQEPEGGVMEHGSRSERELNETQIMRVPPYQDDEA